MAFLVKSGPYFLAAVENPLVFYLALWKSVANIDKAGWKFLECAKQVDLPSGRNIDDSHNSCNILLINLHHSAFPQQPAIELVYSMSFADNVCAAVHLRKGSEGIRK